MVSEEPSTILTRQNIIGADILLCDIEERMGTVMDLITTTDAGTMAQEVWHFINGHAGSKVTRTDLTKGFSHKLGSKDLYAVVDTLVNSGRLTVDIDGNTISYEITGK